MRRRFGTGKAPMRQLGAGREPITRWWGADRAPINRRSYARRRRRPQADWNAAQDVAKNGSAETDTNERPTDGLPNGESHPEKRSVTT